MPSNPKKPRPIYRTDLGTEITDRQVKTGCLGIVLVVVALVAVIGLFKSFNTIDAGDQGIVVCFGTPTETLDPGVHIVAPWCGVSGIDARAQTYVMVAAKEEGPVQGDDSLAVQSTDQVPLGVEAAIIFHLDRSRAADIYARYKVANDGKIPDTLTTVLRNISRRTIHDAGARYFAADLTGGKRGDFGDEAEKALGPALNDYDVVLERVEIRDVKPTSKPYIDSIAAKVAAQQTAQAKQYELEAAEKEKAVKEAQAQGDANAQAIRNSQPPAPALVQQQMVGAIEHTQNKVIITDGKAPVLIQPGG